MNHVKKSINELRTFVVDHQARTRGNGKLQLSQKEIATIIAQFNMLSISALIGAGIDQRENKKTKEKEIVLKGFYFLPNTSEIVEISEIISEFENGAREVYLNLLSSNDEDDMGVGSPAPAKNNVSKLDKVSHKGFLAEIRKGVKRCLNVDDFLRIAAMAENLRRRDIMWFALGTIGVVLIITGVGITVKYLNKKDEACDDYIDNDEIDNMMDIEDDIIDVSIDDEIDMDDSTISSTSLAA